MTFIELTPRQAYFLVSARSYEYDVQHFDHSNSWPSELTTLLEKRDQSILKAKKLGVPSEQIDRFVTGEF